MGSRGESSASKKRMIDRLQGRGGQQVPQPMDVKKFAGMSLQQIEERIRNLNHEELFVLDKDGKVVEEYKGEKDSVAFPSDILYKYPNATVTHGHPKSLEDFGGTLSLNDVYNMLDSNWKEHRATASGKGEMNYIMRRTSKSDSIGLKNKISNEEQDIINKFAKKYSDGYNEANKQGLKGKAKKRYARQKAVGVLNAYYKETFEKYGFEYITRKTEYKYNR